MPRYATALRKGNLQEGKPVRVDVDGKAIVLALVSGKVYAMDAVCSHEGGPLEDGTIKEYSLICPWHQGIFDIRTAKASPETDWVKDLHSYGVVEDASGLVSIDTNPSASNSPRGAGGGVHGIAPQKTAVAEEDVVVPTRPLKFELKLRKKVSHTGTDVMSFRFSRGDSQNNNTTLNYRAGQYAIVDLGTKDDPEGPMRSFTIASSPTEENFIIISTRIRDTPFKKKLASLDVGAPVNITAPLGKFILHEDYSNPAVFLSGGIGVTPFRSMIKYATDAKLPLKIIMFDANRNQDNILFKDEFDEWAKLNENVKIVYTLDIAQDNWKGEQGHINKAMMVKYLDADILGSSIFYICGPPGMLKAMQKLLQDDLKIPKQRIRSEEFSGY